MRTYQPSAQPTQQLLRGSATHAHTSVTGACTGTSVSWQPMLSVNVIEAQAGVRRQFDGKPEANLDMSPPGGWGTRSLLT